MMKIIHTSDWHLGQRFYTYDRDDIKHREHGAFIHQLCELMSSQRPDALLIAGDIFDNIAPSNALRARFVDYIMQLHDAAPSTAIIITAGNHDSGSLLDIEKKLWHYQNVHVFGTCQRRDDGTFDPSLLVVELKGKGIIAAAPYFYHSNYPAATEGLATAERPQAFFQLLLEEAARRNDANLPVILMAHLAIQGSNTRGHEDNIGNIEALPPRLLGQGYDYVALGHIHKPQTLQESMSDNKTHFTGTVHAPSLQVGQQDKNNPTSEINVVLKKQANAVSPQGVIRYSGSPIPLSFTEDYPHSVSLVEIASHGCIPTVTELPITPPRKMLTLQADSLDEGLIMLENVPPDDTSYVRLLIHTNELLPPDANDRARQASECKAWSFCEVQAMKLDYEEAKDKSYLIDAQAEIQQIQKLQPQDIAQEYMRRMGRQLSDTQRKLLDEAISTVLQSKEGGAQ